MNSTFSNTNKLTPNEMQESGHTDSLYDNSKLFLMDNILLHLLLLLLPLLLLLILQFAFVLHFEAKGNCQLHQVCLSFRMH